MSLPSVKHVLLLAAMACAKAAKTKLPVSQLTSWSWVFLKWSAITVVSNNFQFSTGNRVRL